MRYVFRTLPAVFCLLIVCSCSNIKAGLYLAAINDFDGESILSGEPDVKLLLEFIVNSDDDYAIHAFMRTGVNFQMKRTKLVTHSFYLIIHDDEEYYTLSFYGTDMAFRSKGAWTLNSSSDIESYRMYLNGNNRWDVEELFPDNVIDTKQTIQNIIARMDSGNTFYYKAHLKHKPNTDNCNTALYETVALETGW